MKGWIKAAAVLLGICAIGFSAACDKGTSESVGDGHTHVWTSVVVKGETCTENGVALKKCNDCGEEIEVAIPAKHMLEEVDEEPATCTEKGVRYWICQNCEYEQAEEIPKTGHNYVDGVCVNAGCADLERP